MHESPDDTFLRDLVERTIERWRAGEPPDAQALLARHPALSRHKSLAIDLIYEEYCLRREHGDTLVPSTFCDRFPHYRQSLSRMLEVDQVLEANPELRPVEPPRPWPAVGESFLGFALLELLGRGSLARVFLARETAVGNRQVVVKISRHGASEAQMLGKAVHSGIVPILSVTNDERTGWTAICMPLLGTATGTDLLDAAFGEGKAPRSAEVIGRAAGQFRPLGVTPDPVSAAERQTWRTTYAEGIARFGLLLAEGLQAAHEAGVMHRDIKPSNVLLAWSGRPMLLDFNLSTDAGVRSQRVGGTLAYMAPELIEALATDRDAPTRQFDPRADLYSLGALLYELLTGRLPAQPKDAERLTPDAFAPWLEARRRSIVPPSKLNPQVDAALEAIVLRCLAPDAARRPASAGELARELRDFLGAWPTAQRAMRRHRRALIAAAVGGIALVASGAVYVGQLPPAHAREFERGLAQFDRGEYSAAAASFGMCLQLKPDWPEARFARGQALRMAGDITGARGEFLALKDYDIALAYSLAGYCDLVLDNYLGANVDYGLAIEKGADDPVTWTNAGLCAVRQNATAQAIEFLDRAIVLEPRAGLAYCQRALARFRVAVRSQTPPDEQTIRDIREACRLDSDCAEFHFHAAMILLAAAAPEKPEKNAELREQALDHVVQALKLGYPPEAVAKNKFFAPLIGDIPSNLLTVRPNAPKPERLYLSPPQTADLGGFIKR
jgi:serine/threonine protein kinase